MNELIKIVAAKTGLSEAEAKIAIDVVISQLKDKLPDGISNQIETLLGSDSNPSDKKLGGVKGMLGNMFGGE